MRHVSDYDAFERVFYQYFMGLEIPAVIEGDAELFNTREFHNWLMNAWQSGELPMHPNFMDPEELLKKFWDTLRKQQEAHHGGSKWVGTKGRSPFGHSGFSDGGLRLMGSSKNRAALKVFFERKYIDYSQDQTLSHDNMRAALSELKNLKPEGAYEILDIDETICHTAKNGGEIELCFKKPIRNKLKVILFIDNGGSSMLPFADRTQVLFQKMMGQWKSLEVYFFHNTIYRFVYTDPERRKSIHIESILKKSSDTRLFFLGDANMGPHELVSEYGNINWGDEDPLPSIDWLYRLRERFPGSVWLNPLNSWELERGSFTINKIAGIFPMYPLTIRGLRDSVEKMNVK